jgi:hypothetical protein
MKNSLLLLVLLFIINKIDAQPTIQMQKCFGGTNTDGTNVVKSLNGGGYLFVGWSRSNDGDVSGNHGNYDLWVVKMDDSLNLLWQKSLGGSDLDQGIYFEQTPDSGYIISGITRSNDGDVIGLHGNFDIWIVKLDSVGDLQWQKCLGGSSFDDFSSITQTFDGGYMVFGQTSSIDGDVTGTIGGRDYWIVKLNSFGSILWQKCLGGTQAEDSGSIIQTSDSGFVLSGASRSLNGDVIGNHGSSGDVWIVKLDSIGNIEWNRCYGGTDIDYTYNITATSDGGYIIPARSESNDGDVSGNHGGYDAWIVKIDSFGDIQWQKCLGGSGDDFASSIIQNVNNYIVSGITNSNDFDVNGNHGFSDLWTLSLDSVGNILWQKCVGGSLYESGWSVEQLINNELLFGGRAESIDGDVSNNHGDDDAWIVKLSLSTNLIENTPNNEVSIYPNPFNKLTYFNTQKDLNRASLMIYNTLGINIKTINNIYGRHFEFDRKMIPNGIYLFIIKENNHVMYKGKIIIE